MTALGDIVEEKTIEYVTVTIGDQLFGLPIARVQDVFTPGRMTRVPLAPPEIAGVLNLRGRIVTAIDMRCRLGLRERERRQRADGGRHRTRRRILRPRDRCGRRGAEAAAANREPVPVNLDARLARVASGIHRLDGQLLVVLDVDRVLDMEAGALAA